MLSATGQKRISAFTKTDSLCLKGIAIILMMFHHCFRSTDRFEGYEVNFFPFTQDNVIAVSDYFKICVCIFAFITGYGLYLSAKKQCKNLKSCEKWVSARYIKTFSGFWFIYILSFAITQIYDKYPQSVYCKEGVTRGIAYIFTDFLGLSNLFSTPILHGNWWYMSAAIIFIILVPIAIKWSEKLGYITLIVSVVTLPRLLATGYGGGVNAYPFILAVVAGMIFAQYNLFEKLLNIKIAKNKILSEIILFILYFSFLLISIYLWIKIDRNRFWEYHYVISPVISVCFCRKYIIRIPLIKKALAFFGKHSLNVFLIHGFIRQVYFTDFIYSFSNFLISAAVLFLISLAISVVVELIKKLIKYDKFTLLLSNKVCTIIDKF